MTEASALIDNLPDWLKIGANAAVFVVGLAIAVMAVREVRSDDGEHEGRDHEGAREPHEALAAGPVREALTSLATLAENARLQTEAQKVSAAALTALAKLVEDDFDERRVDREVDRRLEIERKRIAEVSRSAA